MLVECLRQALPWPGFSEAPWPVDQRGCLAALCCGSTLHHSGLGQEVGSCRLTVHRSLNHITAKPQNHRITTHKITESQNHEPQNYKTTLKKIPTKPQTQKKPTKTQTQKKKNTKPQNHKAIHSARVKPATENLLQPQGQLDLNFTPKNPNNSLERAVPEPHTQPQPRGHARLFLQISPLA